MNVLLERALQSGEVLELMYISNENEITYRNIKVINLTEDSFQGYCFLRRQQRFFKFDNILSIGPVRARRKGA